MKHDVFALHNRGIFPTFNPLEIRKTLPAAFEALPEVYKNDRSLLFYIDVNDNLIAKHELHTNEEWVWSTNADGKNEWISIPPEFK